MYVVSPLVSFVIVGSLTRADIGACAFCFRFFVGTVECLNLGAQPFVGDCQTLADALEDLFRRYHLPLSLHPPVVNIVLSYDQPRSSSPLHRHLRSSSLIPARLRSSISTWSTMMFATQLSYVSISLPAIPLRTDVQPAVF